MSRRIEVTELAGATVSRPRGAEAYAKLHQLLAQGPLDVALDGARILSASFLDELVLKLQRARELESVTFLVTDESTTRKLERIASIRAAIIYVQAAETMPRHIVERRDVHLSPTFSSKKVPA
jgi:hypothetical protein